MKLYQQELLIGNRTIVHNTSKRSTGIKTFLLLLIILYLITLGTAKVNAQVHSQVASPQVGSPNGPPATPTISGVSSVSPGTTSSAFTTTSGTAGTTFTWSISTGSAGTISGVTSGNSSTGTVHWIGTYSGTVVIYCIASNSYGNSPTGSKSVSVTGTTTPLTAGAISPTSQSVNYNTIPTTAITSTATGGSGTITYQWKSSLSTAGTFTNVTNGTGANSANYTPGALTATTYFQETATSGSSTVTSPVASVTVYPQLIAANPSPASQTITFGTSSIAITSSASGGNSGAAYIYQWQSSPDGQNDYVNVSSSNTSGTTATLNPMAIYSTTYYRLQATNNGVTVYSTPSVITVSDCYQLNTSPTGSSNYIVATTFREPGIYTGLITDAQIDQMGVCDANQTIQYLDGLGRPIQTVQVKASPDGRDIVQPVAYDQYGREVTKYQPYAVAGTTSDGAYQSTGIADQLTFYHPAGSTTGTQQSNGVINNESPYAQTNFEPSPLNRPIEQGAPGDAWQLSTSGVSGSGHTDKIVYNTNNTTSFTADSINGNEVILYNAAINSDNSRTLSSNGYYAAGTLYVTITKDENWTSGRAGTTEEYKDIEGHVVLKRTYNYTGSPALDQMLSTYYVYDNLGDLAFVLPPTSGADAGTPSQPLLDNLCYQYRYDARNRLVQKKLPGKGWEFMIYNTLDQVTFTQDANQRNPSQGSQVYTFIQYDPQGRVALTGIWNSAGAAGSAADNNMSAPSQTLFQWLTNWQNSQTQLWITRNNSTATGYISANPQQSQFLKINYYDDYAFPGQPTTVTKPASASVMLRGLLTGTKTMVLNTINNSTPDMLTSANYYDDLGRVTQTYKQHYLGGSLSPYNYDQVNSAYDFTNEVTGTNRQHYIANSGNTASTLSVTIANTYVFDHEGRRLQNLESINGATPVLLAQNNYNEIGQLLTKSLHSTNSGSSFLQSINYAYNERGWLLSSTAPLFQEVLQYNIVSPLQGLTPVSEFNGNIAAQAWETNGATSYSSYIYGYDMLNRLTKGASGAGTAERAISYDNAGNLLTLKRNQANITGAIDQLTYAYTDVNGNYSNQLRSVTDASTYTGPVGLTTGTTSYTYDMNGNMASQSNPVNTQNKNISYNMLNLPQVYTLPIGTVTYTYDADGNKLRKVSVINGTTATEDYISGIQHTTGGAIDFIQTEEGRALNSGGNYHYEYSLTDHLGNERATFDTYTGSAVLTQSDDYYPFGMEINNSTSSPKNEYLYNKKELQEELGQYDYRARFYDPVIGRFTTIDPLAEKMRRFSPYDYGDDNSIRNIDPDGMETEDANCCGTPGVTGTTGVTGATVKGPQGAVGTSSEEDPAIKELPTLQSTQELADNISDASTEVGLKAGPIVGAVAGPEAGLATMETAGKVGDIATGVSAAIDIMKGNVGDAVAKAGGIIASNAIAHVVNTKTTSAEVKVGANILATGVSKLTEKAIKLVNAIPFSFKASVKSPGTTMQRDHTNNVTPIQENVVLKK